MPDIKGISFFPPAASVGADDLLFVSAENASASSGYDTKNIRAADLGSSLLGDFEYTQELDTDVKKPMGAINELHGSIGADAYDPDATYNTGDLCIKESTLYKCNDDNVTGAWNSAKWDATTIADEINELNTKTNSIYKLEVVQLFNGVSISNNTEYNSNGSTIPHASIPTKTGYTPVAIVNVQAMGYYGSRILLYAWIDTGDGKIHFSAFNTMENFQYTPTVHGYAWVLYFKNELL